MSMDSIVMSFVHLTMAVAAALGGAQPGQPFLSTRSTFSGEQGGLHETHAHGDNHANLFLPGHLQSPEELPRQKGENDIHGGGVGLGGQSQPLCLVEWNRCEEKPLGWCTYLL